MSEPAAVRDANELTPQEVAMLPGLIRRAQELDVLRDFEMLILARAASTWNPCHGIFDHKWLSPECVFSGCKRAVAPARALEPTEAMIDAAYQMLRGALNHQGDYARVEQALRAALATA